MDVTRFALEKTRILFTLLVILTLAGIGSYLSLSRAEDPGFIVRTALVQTIMPGGTPERVEELVTSKLEEAIQEIPQLDSVRSTSRSGVSIIYVDIGESYTDMRPIWDSLRRKVESARADLPEGIIGPSVNDEFGDVFGIQIALMGDGFSAAEVKKVAEQLKGELLQIADVAKVDIVGDREERVYLEYDNTTLANYGLSPAQLSSLLEARNIILPGGDISTGYEKVVLETSGSFESIADVGATLISIPGHADLIRLDNLVQITRGYQDPPTSLSRFKGEEAIILAISMRDGGNILSLGEQIMAWYDHARSVYPVGLEINISQFQPEAVDRKVSSFIGSLVQAVVIVTVVMFAFLGLRTGVVVASLVPTTMVITFFVMGVFGIGIDQMSLASLIIALGMLVDNAIVMSESIMVQMERGKPARQAAMDAARELRGPLLISSLTTSVAFLPIFLAESATGEYTAPLFKVVTITLLCSWIVALTLIPLLCTLILKTRVGSGEVSESRLQQLYRPLLLIFLRRRLLSLGLVVVLFVLALQGARLVPNIFFPPNDRPTFTIDVNLPSGSPLSRAEQVSAMIERYMHENLMAGSGRGVVDWTTFIGSGAPKFSLPYTPEPSSPNYAFLLVNASDRDIIDSRLVPELENYILSEIPDVETTVRPLPLGAPAWPPVAVRLSGPDSDVLFEIADQLEKQLSQVAGVKSAGNDWGAWSKKVSVQVDPNSASQAGVTNQDIAVSMQTHLSGLEVTTLREDDNLIPIVLRSKEEDRINVERLATMNVYSQATGKSVPLAQVVTPVIEWQPGRIERRDGLRTVTVEAFLRSGVTSKEVNAAIEPWLESAALQWPYGYRWEFGGEAETSGKANASIVEKLPIALLLIILLLVVQFNSIRKAGIVLLTIPLAIIGVVIGLLVAKSYFGFMTLLGVISLAGIVINNAIVLIDRIQIEIEENGIPLAEAVIISGQQRLRPILLTTATTVGGLIPLWLGGGPMWEPMAIAIIFGLVFATLLTLGVVPLLYAIFYGVKYPAAEA